MASGYTAELGGKTNTPNMLLPVQRDVPLVVEVFGFWGKEEQRTF